MKKLFYALIVIIGTTINSLGFTQQTPLVRVVVSQSPEIETRYQSYLESFATFYIKEYTKARVVNNGAVDFQLSLDFRKEKGQYVITTSLFDGQTVIDQKSQSLTQFLEIFAHTQSLLDPLFIQAGLMSAPTFEKSLDVAIGIGADTYFQKELNYFFLQSHKVFNTLFLNTQDYNTHYNLFFFKSHAITQNERGMSDFLPLKTLLETALNTPVKTSFVDYNYDLDRILNHLINEHAWQSDNRLAIVFVSNALDENRLKELTEMLTVAKQKKVQLEFVFLETLKESQIKEYQLYLESFGMGFRPLYYKNIYLMENGSINSFIFSQGDLYLEELGDLKTRKTRRISKDGVVKGVEELPTYLKSQGYAIDKLLFSDIGLSLAFDLSSRQYKKESAKSVGYLFKVGESLMMVSDIPTQELKKLKKNGTYYIKGKPVLNEGQVFLLSRTFKVLDNIPPSFLLTDADRIQSASYSYLTKGEGNNLEWYYKATYLGALNGL